MIYTVKGFSIVNESEVDVFLELSCFLYDPMNVGNLFSGSSAFSKSSLYIWKCLVQVLLTLSLKDFVNNLTSMGFPGGSAGKESTCNAGDLGSIPGLGRYPGEGNSYPLQCSGLENSMDCIVQGIANSQTRLSNFHSLTH